MRLVILESPFAGDVEANIKYAKACIKDCLLLDEAPIASHLLFTQKGILDDTKPEERKLGIGAGHAWYAAADAAVMYVDRGISSGMIAGIKAAAAQGIVVETRLLPGYRAEDFESPEVSEAKKLAAEVAEAKFNSVSKLAKMAEENDDTSPFPLGKFAKGKP